MKQNAAIRAELMQWTLGTPVDNPGETLLRLITQSRQRADLYSGLLEQAYEAAERLRKSQAAHDLVYAEDARRDLDQVLQTGGVSVLIGKTWGAAGKDGDIYATGEAIRGLALLEAQERERCARFCKLAIDAGIAERLVRLAERQADVVIAAVEAALEAAGVTGKKLEEAKQVAACHLRPVASGS